MAFERSYPASKIYEGEGGYPHYEAISNIIIKSPGWSGKVVRTDSQDIEDRSFMFDIAGSMSNEYVTANPHYEVVGHGGRVNYYNSPTIIGISLEHFGKLEISTDRDINQLRGYILDSSDNPQLVPAFGGTVGASALSVDDGNIIVDEYTVDDGTTQTTTQDVGYRNCNFPAYEASPFYADLNPSWSVNRANNSSGTLTTDLPIFATDADLLEYVNSEGEIVEKMLNYATPEDDYEERFAFWYVHNVYGKNTRTASSYTAARNYRFFPQSEQKIAFLAHRATSAAPYTLELQTDFSYVVKSAGAFDTDDGDYEEYGGSVPTTYLDKSISFGNDYYTKFIFDTNIPIAGSQQDIDDYFAGIKTIEEIALNWDQIARQDDYLLDPEWQGTTKDSETPTGSNGMTYTYGSKLYEVSNIELAALFTEVFDPDNVQAILDGNKLFSSETLACINSITYFPLTSMSEVCEMGGTGNVWIGSWESQNCQGTRINKNNKKINIGTFQMSPTYNDFRDFEPYTRVYCQLPFAGCHELTVSKYMGKAVKVEASIDITTGTILYLLYGNNILLDMFSGTCGAQRPFTARDSAQYISNVVNAVTGASNTMTSASKGASDIANGMSAASKAGVSAEAVTAGGVVAGGALIGVGAVEGVYKAYGIKNAIDNPPLISTGSLAGCAAYAANTKVSFIVAQKKTIVPANLQTILGRPSNQGGTVGSFTGYLKCSAFSMSNFTGTKAELDEIYSIMAQGIYI